VCAPQRIFQHFGHLTPRANKGRALTGTEIVSLKQGISVTATTIAGVVQVLRAGNTLSRRDLQLLRVYAEKTISLARVHAAGEIARAIMQELIETTREVERMSPAMYPYGITVLESLHYKLRGVLDDF